MLQHASKTWLRLTGALGLLAGLLAAAGTASAADTLLANQSMSPGTFLESANAGYRFNFQTDGNLVLRSRPDNTALWASGTNGRGGTRLTMQSDGNLVLYTSANVAVWASNTVNSGGNRAVMQNGGNFVILNSANGEVWSTGTGSPPVTGSVSKVGFVLKQVSGGGADLTIERPSTVQAGDLLVLITQGGDGQLPATQSGWTPFATCFERGNADTACSSSGGDLGLVAYYRVASTSGAASYTIDSGSSGHVIAAILALRGANNGNPIYSYKFLPNDGNGSESHCPSTSGIAGGYHVCAYSHDDPQPLTGFSPLTLQGQIFCNGDCDSVHVSARVLSSGGNTPYVVSTNSASINGGNNDLQLAFVIRPQ